MTVSNQTLKFVAVAIVSLAIGYFAGREHLKYEMRSAFSTAAEELKQGLSNAFAGEGTSTPTATSKSTKKEEPAKPQPIGAVVTAKDFRNRDYDAGIYEEAITFTVRFDNRTGKDVRAFEGRLTFLDLLDNDILGSRVAINDSVKAGATMDWEGKLDYNEFMDDHERLRNEALENLKTRFIVTKILFSDGSSQKL